ncbi:MAG: hypothetical protein Phyf2KO_20150 [Phycisphaerales bacterium]
MPLPVAAILTILLFAGLSMLFAGLYIRRGDRPRCASCSYDLSALIPDSCPECNEDLSEARGVVRGDRRRLLAGVGLVVVLLSIAGFGIGFLGGATLDQHKPVWLLDVELLLVNEKGEERIKEELRRRLFDNTTTVSEKHAIADLALRRASASYSEPMSSLLTDCAVTGLVDAKKAEPYMRELIALWSSDWLMTEEGGARSLELSAMVQGVGIDLEAIKPIIRKGVEWSTSTPSYEWSQAEHDRVRRYEILLGSWWHSPDSPGCLTTDYVNAVFEGIPLPDLFTRQEIEAGTSPVPYRVHQFLVPIAMGPNDRLSVKHEVVGVRISQQGETLYEMIGRQGGMSLGLNQSSLGSVPRGAFGSTHTVEGLEPGEAEIEIDVRLVIYFNTSGDPVLNSSQLDEQNSNVAVDRVIPLRTKTIVVPKGEDGIEQLMSGESGTPMRHEVLEWFAFSPLYYNTSKTLGSSGPWSLGLDRSADAEGLLHRWGRSMPDLDIAYRVMATQGETEWDIGTFECRDVFNLTTGLSQRVSPPEAHIRTNDTGELEWGVPVPDFDRPVRLRLEPAPDVARQSIDLTSIYGETIDLGNFVIVQTDESWMSQGSQVELKPAPILRDE